MSESKTITCKSSASSIFSSPGNCKVREMLPFPSPVGVGSYKRTTASWLGALPNISTQSSITMILKIPFSISEVVLTKTVTLMLSSSNQLTLARRIAFAGVDVCSTMACSPNSRYRSLVFSEPNSLFSGCHAIRRTPSFGITSDSS